MSVAITEVGGRADELERFVGLPWHIYRDDPGWIPPDPRAVHEMLSPRNPFFGYGRMCCWLARGENGEVVGRCAAMINGRLAQDGTPVGLVGFFECVDDEGVAARLFESAAQWLRAQGARQMWGPMQMSIWHSYRLKVGGFEREPFFGEPHNPPYYARLFTRCGLEPIGEWNTWDLSRPMMQRLVQASRATPRHEVEARGLHTEPMDLGDADGVLELLHRMMASSFDQNFGYSAIDFDEFKAIYVPMLPLLIPPLVRKLVDASGTEVGFSLCFRDVGALVRQAAKTAEPPAPSADALQACRPVLHTLVLTPQVQGVGVVNALFVPETLGWALEAGHSELLGVLAKQGRTFGSKESPPARRYAMYGQVL